VVALVVALAARGPVSDERRVGAYTVQLFVDPTRAGENDLHVTFVDAAGLAAGDMVNTEVGLAAGSAPPEPVGMRLLSPGHFVGEVTLARPGPYRLAVRAPGPAGPVATPSSRTEKNP
jgi:hypothetical protein